MSYAATNNVQYRLSEFEGGTLIKFHHMALGFIPEEHRRGVVKGWNYILSRIQTLAEAGSRKNARSK
jgi:hypothetical protein